MVGKLLSTNPFLGDILVFRGVTYLHVHVASVSVVAPKHTYCQFGDYMLPTTFYKNPKNSVDKRGLRLDLCVD